MIITAGGENVSPIPIEDRVKAELPNLISNCMLVGDKRKYLVILITLKVIYFRFIVFSSFIKRFKKCKVDLETLAPLDDLTEDCIKYLTSIGSTSKKVSEIIDNKDSFVYKAIEDGEKQNSLNFVSDLFK